MLNISVPAGQILFTEGDAADCAYLVEEGWVEIFTERAGWKQSLSLIGTGEIFGEMGVIDGSPRTASAVAAEDCRLLKINVEQFRALLGRAEPFHAELLTKLVARFREAQRAWMDGSLLPRLESSEMGPGYAQLARHRDIAQALDKGEIVPFFQPIVSLATGHWRGFEALARWRHGDGRVVAPADFLPLAERTGLIRRIDFAIAEFAMSMLSTVTTGPRPFLNVNFSARHFRDDHLAGNLAALIDKTGLAPEQLHIELTESLMLEDPDRALKVMGELARIGVKLTLDDFGTGYSSLSVLHRMPIDIVKIDRSLVQGGIKPGRSRALLRNVVALAADLGMEVVPEGIEDQQTADMLMGLGCHTGQGYFFARPMPATDGVSLWRNGEAANGKEDLPGR